MSYILFHDDCLNKMSKLEENSIDSIVTDPPYGLSFMGKNWDHGVPCKSFWSEALRVAKPGAHLLAFGGTRTYHRLACAIEDAGWEIRDCVMWVYGSGFPKSHNVGNAVDKHNGCGNRGHAISSGSKIHPTTGKPRANGELLSKYEGRTEEGKKWEGWGTALKPAWEPIIVARKPLAGTVAENVLAHGVGGLNIDGCRVEGGERPLIVGENDARKFSGDFKQGSRCEGTTTTGRWPANIIHDGSDEVLALFPDTGKSTGGRTVKRSGGGNVGSGKTSEVSWTNDDPGYGDSGSAARFFYCAKASKADRDEGCEKLEIKPCGTMEDDNYDIKTGSGNSRNTQRRNFHPTVKPTALMRYLCRLVTPPGGVVLDPFLDQVQQEKPQCLRSSSLLELK